MLEDNINIRVRYADTDQMGFVYYGNYAKYYEIARVELFRNIGLTYKSLEEMGIGMPVIEMKTNFIMPAKYDEKLVVNIKIPELPKLKIIFFYEIFNDLVSLVYKSLGRTRRSGNIAGKLKRMLAVPFKIKSDGKTFSELEKNEKLDKYLLRYLTVKVKKFDLENNYFKIDLI